MAHYALGKFQPGRSGSPFQFSCLNVYPKGPNALLNIQQLRINPPIQGNWYLFELKGWDHPDQTKQYVTRIIASLHDIHKEIMTALKAASWELVTERRHSKVRIVGKVLKTQYGCFTPEYRSGLNVFGPGQDVDPWISFEPYPFTEDDPYNGVWMTSPEEVRSGYLCCIDEAEIKRAHDAGIAKEDLGDLLREKLGR